MRRSAASLSSVAHSATRCPCHSCANSISSLASVLLGRPRDRHADERAPDRGDRRGRSAGHFTRPAGDPLAARARPAGTVRDDRDRLDDRSPTSSTTLECCATNSPSARSPGWAGGRGELLGQTPRGGPPRRAFTTAAYARPAPLPFRASGSRQDPRARNRAPTCVRTQRLASRRMCLEQTQQRSAATSHASATSVPSATSAGGSSAPALPALTAKA
jgi:hypothetical protein